MINLAGRRVTKIIKTSKFANMDIFQKNQITKEEFEKRERKVLGHMVRVYSDVMNVEKFLRKENYKKFMEDIMILVLVLADSMSRFFEIIESGTDVNSEGTKLKTKGKNKERFTKWIDTFVLNEVNNIYRERKKDINCDSEIVWKIRNSLIHFYGLPDLSKENEQIMLLNGSWHEERGEKMIKFFKNKGVNLRAIDIDGLRAAILESSRPWQGYLRQMLEQEPQKYLTAVLKLLEVTEKECSAKIDTETARRI